MFLPIPFTKLALDLETQYKFIVTQTFIGGNAKGLMFDELHPVIEKNTTIPDMPMVDIYANDTFQVFVSTYLMDSVTTSLL